MKAVIQCGGKGTRLRPYTAILPKPLMPIGSKPVLEMLIFWLRRNGIRDIFVTTGYLGHLIQSFCGDGHQWDVRISYTAEAEPLGTLGALSLLRNQLDCPFLTLNGDILTDLNLNAFSSAHRAGGTNLTVATSARTVRMDFGVIEDHEARIVRFREKPILSQNVSMGIYCMEPKLLEHIPDGVPFGFDDLVFRMLEDGEPVGTFLHRGFWLDVGRVEDFRKAQEISWESDVPGYEITESAFGEVSELV